VKILAIDFGMKRMGFAVGNTVINTAVLIEPIDRKNSRQVVEHIKRLVSDYEIERILLGYPLNMDGSKSPITREVEHFAQRLGKSLVPGLEITFMDERLSSFEAEEELKTLHRDYKKRKKILDSMSALVILRHHMDMENRK
jgi:putative Holliday junction resolvase